MSVIAVIGAGPLGGALAHALAQRDRVREVRLIDPQGNVAEGKALDILQSGPVDQFSTRVCAARSVLAAAGADVIVLADAASGQEHGGEAGLSLLRQIAAVEATAPVLCAGVDQRGLIARGVEELHIAEARLIGSAPFALESALRALTGVALDGSGVEVSLRLVGVPPLRAVVAWEEATAFGQPLSTQLAAHRIAGLAARIPGLWPPGPYALASAACRVTEALVNGTRRRFSCFVFLGRGKVASMPVELDRRGVRAIVQPALSAQERTLLDNALAAP